MEVFLIFLTKIEKLTFGDAVRRLASKAGMSEYKFSKLDVETEKKVNGLKKFFNYFLIIVTKIFLQKKQKSFRLSVK